TRQAESRPGRIGPINLGMKQMGERSAGNPHAAFDVEGTGDVARHRPKPARQSSTLPPEGRDQTCQLGPGLPRLPPPITVVPFISQIATSPLLFCHNTSDFPSPLKSPVATACQLGPGLPRLPPPITVVPFISQIATSPLLF